MKAHIGVDAESGLVHTAGVTTGKVHDAKVMYNLIRESPDSYDDRLGPDKKISGSADGYAKRAPDTRPDMGHAYPTNFVRSSLVSPAGVRSANAFGACSI